VLFLQKKPVAKVQNLVELRHQNLGSVFYYKVRIKSEFLCAMKNQIWGPLIWLREKVAMGVTPPKKHNSKSAGFV
jgi:hypothetical protein